MKRNGISPLWKVLLPLLPIAAALFALCAGRMSIGVGDVLASVWAKLTGGEAVSGQVEMVLWKIRFPRILLALLVGAGLSVSGAAFQSLFSNPLASPDTLGVASGASFGAALGLLLELPQLGVQLSAVLFGMLAMVLTVLTGMTKNQRALSSVVLSGIMIGSLFSALVSFVKFTADTETKLPAITYFLMGNLSAANYRSLAIGAPVIILGVLILFLLRWRMNLLPLTEEEARAFGVNLNLLRGVTAVCASAIASSCIAMCGQVGWVGLIVPHMARMLFGSNHMHVIPASIFIGSAYLVLVDTAARSISAAELPISILTALIGAPFFILLMRKTEGGML